MAGSETVYSVRIDYRIGDSATNALKDIARHSQSTARALMDLRRAFYWLGGSFILREAKDALIGYNAKLEQMKLTLTSIAHMNLGGSWEDATKSADKLFNKLQTEALKNPSSTAELVKFATVIESSFLRAGGTTGRMGDYTSGAVVAAKMLGFDEIGARDVQRMLTGSLTTRNQFARAMIEPAGYTTKSWNEMARKNPLKAIEESEKLFTSPTIKTAVNKYMQTFTGAWSNVEERMQKSLGEVGLPLFKALTKELVSWNEWLQKNPEKVAQTVKDLGEGLVSAFTMVKGAVQAVIDNKEDLMTLAKLMLVFKVGQAGAGAFASPAAGLGGIAGAFSKLTNVTALLIGEFLLLKAYFAELDREQTATIDREAIQKNIVEYATNQHRLGGTEWMTRLKGQARDLGALDEDGNFSAAKFRMGAGIPDLKQKIFDLEGIQGTPYADPVRLAEARRNLIMLEDAIMLLGASAKQARDNMMFGPPSPTQEDLDYGNRRAKKDRDIKVTIQRVEVSSNDPDRWVHGMMNAFNDIAENPTQAKSIVGGVSE